MQGPEADGSTQFVHSAGFGEIPRSNPAITGVIQPLGAIELRPALIHSNPVFQICGVPERDAAGGFAGANHAQSPALKLRLSDCMLDDQPGRFGSVLTRETLIGPAVLREHFRKPGSISRVQRLHARNVPAAQFTALLQFAPDTRIFSAHVQKFPAQFLIDHRGNSGSRRI